jgi:hypothetical protein
MTPPLQQQIFIHHFSKHAVRMKKLFSILTVIATAYLLLLSMFTGSGCDMSPEPLPCDAPTDVQVIAISPTSARLTWSAPAGATVEISVEPQSNPPGPFTTTSDTFTITGLLPGTNYVARLRTICGSGDTSTVTNVSFRTSTIIIGDVIIQRAISEDVKALCGGNNDVSTQNTPINWDPSLSLELLKIEHTSSGTVVFIEKDTRSGGIIYKSAKDKDEVCGVFSQNTPVSTNAIGSGFVLNGNNYNVNINATNAQMNPTMGGTVNYTMYR